MRVAIFWDTERVQPAVVLQRCVNEKLIVRVLFSDSGIVDSSQWKVNDRETERQSDQEKEKPSRTKSSRVKSIQFIEMKWNVRGRFNAESRKSYRLEMFILSIQTNFFLSFDFYFFFFSVWVCADLFSWFALASIDFVTRMFDLVPCLSLTQYLIAGIYSFFFHYLLSFSAAITKLSTETYWNCNAFLCRRVFYGEIDHSICHAVLPVFCISSGSFKPSRRVCARAHAWNLEMTYQM